MTQHSPSAHGETGNDGAEPRQNGPMAMCPMAETCKGMAAKRMPKFLLALPGLVFIAAGLLILLVPALLVWFFALASIAMGVMMLVFASFMSRMGTRFRRMHP